MKAVTGVFNSSSEGKHAILKLRSLGIAEENINFLTPSDSVRALTEVPPWKLNSPEWERQSERWSGGLRARPWARLDPPSPACWCPAWVRLRPWACMRPP